MSVPTIRLRRLVTASVADGNEDADMTIDVSGDWIFDGRPFNTAYDGQIRLRLEQSGSRIDGDLVQLQDPRTGQPPTAARSRS